MLNSILMVPGPLERLNKLKNRFFENSENFKKLQKIISDRAGPDQAGPDRAGPDQAGPDRTRPDRTGNR